MECILGIIVCIWVMYIFYTIGTALDERSERREHSDWRETADQIIASLKEEGRKKKRKMSADKALQGL